MKLAVEFLRSGAFFNCVSLYHPITESFRFGDFRRFDKSFLPLHCTCAHGMTDLVEPVLEERAKAVAVDGLGDINAMSNFGSTLAIASSRGHLNIVKVLVDEYANVDLWQPQPDDVPLEYKDIKNTGIPGHDDNRVPASFGRHLAHCIVLAVKGMRRLFEYYLTARPMPT